MLATDQRNMISRTATTINRARDGLDRFGRPGDQLWMSGEQFDDLIAEDDRSQCRCRQREAPVKTMASQW